MKKPNLITALAEREQERRGSNHRPPPPDGKMPPKSSKREPRRAVSEVISWQPFPVDAFPEPCRRFIVESARAIGCDASYIALPLLSALAAAIGNTRSIRLKPGWDEPSVIWSATVGDSGTMKSPAVDAPLKPIRKRQAEAIKQHQHAMARYERDCQLHEAAKLTWKKRPNTTEPPPEPPEKPVCERFWCADITVEALAERLAHAQRGLLLVRDELAGWLRNSNKTRLGSKHTVELDFGSSRRNAKWQSRCSRMDYGNASNHFCHGPSRNPKGVGHRYPIGQR